MIHFMYPPQQPVPLRQDCTVWHKNNLLTTGMAGSWDAYYDTFTVEEPDGTEVTVIPISDIQKIIFDIAEGGNGGGGDDDDTPDPVPSMPVSKSSAA